MVKENVHPKILIIVPYFGVLPSYFNIWLKSVENNPEVDFLFLTDSIIAQSVPKNLLIRNLSFDSFKERLQQSFDFPISLKTAYKICDFRPAFGEIFEKELVGYDLWGHCDVDLIFGDLRMIWNQIDISSYDKFFCYGHLSLYKNTRKLNSLYRMPGSTYTFEQVFSSDYHFAFDEVTGITQIALKQKIRIYFKTLAADIDVKSKVFRLNSHGQNYNDQKFLWDGRDVMRVRPSLSRDVIDKFLYLHFQKKTLSATENDLKSNKPLLISSEKLRLLNDFSKNDNKSAKTNWKDRYRDLFNHLLYYMLKIIDLIKCDRKQLVIKIKLRRDLINFNNKYREKIKHES